MYCDGLIWKSGSVGEGINSSSVLVVKTHRSWQHWVKQTCSNPNSVITVQISYKCKVCFLPSPLSLYSVKYKAAVFILRNPYDALVSGYKWLVSSKKKGSNPHTMEVDNSMFGK